MRGSGRKRFIKRLLPGSRGLVRKPGDQVDVEIRNPGRAQAGDIVQHSRSLVQSPDRSGFNINERLHAQADAIYAAAQQCLQRFLTERAGRALDRDLGVGMHLKLRSNRVEDPLQLSGLEDGGSAAAEIDRIHLMLELSTHLLRGLRSARHVGAHSLHIALKNGARKHVGREIAVAALRLAERHRNVDS